MADFRISKDDLGVVLDVPPKRLNKSLRISDPGLWIGFNSTDGILNLSQVKSSSTEAEDIDSVT